MSNLTSFQHTFGAPFGIGVQKGIYEKLSGWEASGYNPDVGTTFETVWGGSTNYTYPGSALTMTVTSAAGATDAGVEVTIIGLDTNYAMVTQTVTLNASGTATTTQAFLRIHRAYISNGSSPTANITIANGGTTYGLITYPYNTTQMAVYTVPAGKRAYLVYADTSLEKQKEVVAKLLSRRPGGILITGGIIGTTGSFSRQWVIPPLFDEKTDIEIRAKAGATTSISASMQFVLEDK